MTETFAYDDDVFGCPVCGPGTRVRTVDSRPHVVGNTRTVLRRKECTRCRARYSTAELPFTLAKEVLSDD
jgi:transcriptional regulator NrdR family protein